MRGVAPHVQLRETRCQSEILPEDQALPPWPTHCHHCNPALHFAERELLRVIASNRAPRPGFREPTLPLGERPNRLPMEGRQPLSSPGSSLAATGVISTLSMRAPSRSTISKPSPCQAIFSPVTGMCPNMSINMPASV